MLFVHSRMILFSVQVRFFFFYDRCVCQFILQTLPIAALFFLITLRHYKKKKKALQRAYFLFMKVFLLCICKFNQ